jgi:hypothetical protein
MFDPESTIQNLLRQAAREHEYWDLAGMNEKECPDPYKVLAKALRRGLRDLQELSTHEHVWREDHYCVICGADGRA